MELLCAVIQFGATAAWWRAAKGQAPSLGQLSPLNVIAGLAIFGAGQVQICTHKQHTAQMHHRCHHCHDTGG